MIYFKVAVLANVRDSLLETLDDRHEVATLDKHRPLFRLARARIASEQVLMNRVRLVVTAPAVLFGYLVQPEQSLVGILTGARRAIFTLFENLICENLIIF